jgi:dTDP-4-amino-4,6-dideoxygalactose transaminase
VRALSRLPAFQGDAAERATRRIAELANIAGLTVLHDSTAVPEAAGTWPALWVLLPTSEARDALLRAQWGSGLGFSLPFVHALPDYPQYAGVVPRATAGTLPHARDLAGRVLSISNSPWLDDARFAQVCGLLRAAVVQADGMPQPVP